MNTQCVNVGKFFFFLIIQLKLLYIYKFMITNIYTTRRRVYKITYTLFVFLFIIFFSSSVFDTDYFEYFDDYRL